MSREARHSSESNEHYTPGYIVNRCRFVFGPSTDVGGKFDLDPASNDAYAPIIGAANYYTEGQDGLSKPWAGKVWLNPPGGNSPDHMRKITKSHAALWWHFLALHYAAGNIELAFFLGFSVEQLQSTQLIDGLQSHPLDYPTLFFNRRLQFMTEDLKPGKNPSHSSFLTFLPPKDERAAEMIRRFTIQMGAEGKFINV